MSVRQHGTVERNDLEPDVRLRSARRNVRYRVMTVAIMLELVGCSPSDRAPSAERATNMTFADVPASLRGVWMREWIERRGVKTSTFDVHYLQTPSHFADVRFPNERRVSPQAKSFVDLTDAELMQLAKQRGFSGRTTLNGAISTWHHEIDFQPSDGSEDIGRIESTDVGHMYEHALDRSYVESWRAVSNGDGRFLAIRVERDGRLARTLLLAGDHFLYVRNRARDLPAAASLDSLIATTHATRAQIIEFLDCEFSAGRIRGGKVPWEIERSTLPWRERQPLDFIDQLEVVRGSGRVSAKGTTSEKWTVPVNTISPAVLDSLFAMAALKR